MGTCWKKEKKCMNNIEYCVTKGNISLINIAGFNDLYESNIQAKRRKTEIIAAFDAKR